MSSYRGQRINEMMMRELSQIIPNVKDYRVSSAIVTITGVECAADLKSARVFFSAMGGDYKEVKAGLVSAHGFIRTSLARAMDLRQTPELRFIPDESIERGARMNDTFKKIAEELKEADIRDEREAAEEAEKLKESETVSENG